MQIATPMAGGLDRCQERLAAAAAAFTRQALEPGAAPGRELEATLLRLGVPLRKIAAIRGERCALAPGRLAEIREVVARELAGLARSARATRASYDLNRHIAVFRTHRALAGADAARPASAQSRMSVPARRPARAARSSATAAPAASSIRR